MHVFCICWGRKSYEKRLLNRSWEGLGTIWAPRQAKVRFWRPPETKSLNPPPPWGSGRGMGFAAPYEPFFFGGALKKCLPPMKNVTRCFLVKPKFPRKVAQNPRGPARPTWGRKKFALTREKSPKYPYKFPALTREQNPGKNRGQKNSR